jgi:PhnB protein
MDPYLSFDGGCEAAFSLYATCLGGRLGPLFRYAGSPMMDQVPPDWADKVMHGSLELRDRVLMGADAPPGTYQAAQGFSLSLQIANTDEAERVFRELAEGGKVLMPLEKTFWAARFGVLVDRFGIPWQVNCEGSDQAGTAERLLP